MAVGSIRGPRAKIWRAAEHKAQLDDAIDAWLDRQPYGVFGRELASGWFETRIREIEPPHIRLGTMFGDFVYNLESALDLLIYQLVIASDNDPGTGNYFPVVTIPEKWDRARRDKLNGVKDCWADRIKAIQPFHEGDRASSHWLSFLHAANKVNKHNVITPTVVVDYKITPRYEFNRLPEPGDHVIDDPSIVPPTIGSKLVDNQLLGRLRAVSARGDLRIMRIVGMQPGNIGIGFDVPVKVFGEAPNLIEHVIGVVDEFEDVLSAERPSRLRIEGDPPGPHDEDP